MLVIKRDGKEVQFDFKKIEKAILAAAKSVNETLSESINEEYFLSQLNSYPDCKVSVEDIQNIVEKWLMRVNPIVAKEYILYREKHRVLRDFVKSKTDFIEAYKKSSNTANATVDDNSNVANKNSGILNNEIDKTDNIQISRGNILNLKFRSYIWGVPVVAQRKQIQLVTMRLQVRSLASLSGLKI